MNALLFQSNPFPDHLQQINTQEAEKCSTACAPGEGKLKCICKTKDIQQYCVQYLIDENTENTADKKTDSPKSQLFKQEHTANLSSLHPQKQIHTKFTASFL